MVDYSEKKAAKRLGGRLTQASGAVSDDADIKCGQFLIESKRREKNPTEIVFYPKFWDKLIKQSVKCRKRPVYMWHTGNKSFVVMYEDDLLNSLIQMNRKYIMVIFPHKENVNFRFSIDTFEKETVSWYRNGYQPYAGFSYKNIPMALIDFAAFKEIVESLKE